MIRVFTRPCGKTYNEQHKAAYELLGAAAGLCGYRVTEIKKTESGKPYFENSDVFFSISHTDGYCAVAIGKCPCGIDIEGGRQISEKVRQRFLDGCNSSDSLRAWTERESYGKLTGEGFFYKASPEKVFFKSFSVEDRVLTVCVYEKDALPSNIEKI